MSQDERESNLETPESVESTVVIARDGRSALCVLYYEDAHSLLGSESVDSFAMYFTVRLVPKEPESRLRVVMSRYVWRKFDPSWQKQLENVARGDALMELALDTIGAHLDAQGMPPYTPSGSPASIELSADQKEPQPATDQETFNYAAAKIYWSWKFGLDQTRFNPADYLRLEVQLGDIDRVAIRGNGVYWEPHRVPRTTDAPSYMAYRPTAKLLDDCESGRLPGQSASPIFQVQEKLAAPRYDAPREHFSKAAGYITSATPDLPNAAKEAVSALESLAKILTDRSDGTLGDAIKSLRAAGKLPAPLDKMFEGIWGFASSTPGVRHGGTTPPDVPESQAVFIVNSAAAAILYLLDLDK